MDPFEVCCHDEWPGGPPLGEEVLLGVVAFRFDDPGRGI